MLADKPTYITDKKGKRISVIIPIEEYERILNELEELEDVRLYDAAKKSNEPSLPIGEAFKQIESQRKTI